MFTSIDKNLLIAAMESAIFQVYQRANITSLSAIETRVSALRQKFDLTPENVADAEIFALIDTIQKAQIPDFKTIDSVPRADVAYSYIWERILNKPTTFPPTKHAHVWQDISSKPTTFPPSEHTHEAAAVTWESIDDKPTTFPPAEHTHEAQPVAVTWADVTDKPTTFPPAEHTHEALSVAWDAIDDKPTTFAPSEHTHAAQCAQVSWVGNGTIPRNISLPFEIVGGELSSTSTNDRKGRLFVNGKLRSYSGTTYSAEFSVTGNILTCSVSWMNSAGVSFDLLVWRA